MVVLKETKKEERRKTVLLQAALQDTLLIQKQDIDPRWNFLTFLRVSKHGFLMQIFKRKKIQLEKKRKASQNKKILTIKNKLEFKRSFLNNKKTTNSL